MKKGFIYVITILIIAILTIFLVIKFEHKNDNKNLKTIKVAEVTHSVFYTPFYVALENNYFKDLGINIDLLLVSGSDNVAASVLSGDTSIGLAGPESAIFVYTGGEKDYLQVFSGLTKRDGQFIVSRNDDFKWTDLIGKEILVGRSTGMPAMSFFRALENEGIDKREVKINTSIDFAELSGTFIGGNGDYVNLFEPTASKLENNKQGYVVKSVGLSSDPFPYTAFYAKKSFIKENKSLLTDFTKAINKGLEYVKNNDNKDIAKIIKPQFPDATLDELEIQIKHYKEADVWMDNPKLAKDFYDTLIDLLKENNLIKKTVNYNDMVNNLYE